MTPRVSVYCSTESPEGCAKCEANPGIPCTHHCHRRFAMKRHVEELGIVFEEPAQKMRGLVLRLHEKLVALTEFPNQWARIDEYEKAGSASGAANQLKKAAANGATPPGQWEFAARAVDGRGRLYARFLGVTKSERKSA